MPRLPDYTSLDTVTPQSARPIASYDATQVGRAISGVGDAINSVSSDIVKANNIRKEQQDKIQSAYAESNLLQGIVGIKRGLEGDPDYTTYASRYNAGIADITKQSADMITDPMQRQLFEAKAGVHTSTGLSSVLELAHTQEKNYGQASLIDLLEANKTAAVQASDEPTRASLIGNTQSAIGSALGKGYITPEQAVKMRTEFAEKYATTRAEMLSPQEQIKLLKPTIPVAISSDIQNSINTAAQNNGVDSGTLTKIAMLESGGNPSAKNPNAGSTSSGLFQFTDATAKQYGLTNPQDANASADAAARLLSDNTKSLQSKLGRSPTPDELYLAHQQGVGGAAALLANPKKNAVDVLADVYGDIGQAKAAVTQNGGNEDMTAGEFAGKWKDKFNSTTTGDQPYFQKTNTWVDYIPPEKRIALIRQNQGVLRADLESRIKDSVSMAQQGQENPNPVSKNDFNIAYGTVVGDVKYQEFQNQQQLGENLHLVGAMTPQEQTAILFSSAPKPGNQFAEQQKNYEILQTAIAHSNDQRQKDPMAWGLQNNLVPNEQLAITNPAALTGQIDSRASHAKMLTETYGVKTNLFTTDEAKAMASYLDGVSINNKLSYIKSLSDGIGDPQLYRNTLEQIRPDSPVTAMAGAYVGLGGQVTTATHLFSADEITTPMSVAQHLLQGEALLNPTKSSKQEDGIGKQFPMPKDKDLRADFDSVVGTAYAGNPQGQNEAFQAVRDYYAAEASTQGKYDGSYDSGVGQKSIKAILGDVTNINGSNVIPPWGMNATQFHDVAFSKFNQAIANNGYNAEKTKWDDINLLSTGEPNNYAIRAGNGFMLDKNGRPIILNINQSDQVPVAITAPTSTDISLPYPKM